MRSCVFTIWEMISSLMVWLLWKAQKLILALTLRTLYLVRTLLYSSSSISFLLFYFLFLGPNFNCIAFYIFIMINILSAEPLWPSTLLIDWIKNLKIISIWWSSFITMSKSFLAVLSVKQFQESNGTAACLAIAIRFMCFLIFQKVEEKPPNWIERISSTLILHSSFDSEQMENLFLS